MGGCYVTSLYMSILWGAILFSLLSILDKDEQWDVVGVLDMMCYVCMSVVYGVYEFKELYLIFIWFIFIYPE